MLKGFREFIMRGNVIDLAVAVVIGAAFTSVVNAIVNGLFNPLIGAFFQADSLDKAMIWTIPGTNAEIQFGLVLGAVINFLIIAAVVYFVFVMPINKMKEMQEAKRKAGIEDAADVAAPVTELDLLTEIRDALVAREEKQLR